MARIAVDFALRGELQGELKHIDACIDDCLHEQRAIDELGVVPRPGGTDRGHTTDTTWPGCLGLGHAALHSIAVAGPATCSASHDRALYYGMRTHPQVLTDADDAWLGEGIELDKLAEVESVEVDEHGLTRVTLDDERTLELSV